MNAAVAAADAAAAAAAAAGGQPASPGARCSCCDPATGAPLPFIRELLRIIIPALNTAHSFSHDSPCQEEWAAFLNHPFVVAWTTGEECEQWWGVSKRCGNPTKHMGLGRRQDYLIQFIAAWNIGKAENVKLGFQHLTAAVERVGEREKKLADSLTSAGGILECDSDAVLKLIPETRRQASLNCQMFPRRCAS